MADLPLVPDPASPPVTRGIVLTRAAAVYDLLSPPMLFWQEQPINRRAARFLGPEPNWQVLDLGCATGGMTLAVAAYLDPARGGLAVGLDASSQMIQVARRKGGRLPCRFDIGIAEHLPYEDSSFDAVVSTFFLHHLNRADKYKALCEARRVLRPGGVALVVDIDRPTNWIGRISVFGAVRLFRQPEIAENASGLLPDLFMEAGFQKVERLAHNLGYLTSWRLK